MKILIAAPWFRTIARTHAANLQSLGHDVRVVTTAAQGKRSVAESVVEETLRPQLRSLTGVGEAAAIDRRIRVWKPDVSLLDMTWDFRFHKFARTASHMITLVHDARPHDDLHIRKGWKKAAEGRSVSSADSLACFSQYVANCSPDSRMTKLMLPSELIDDYHVRRTQRRRGFAFVGRISPYKGLDFLLSSWDGAQSQLSPDECLTIIGDGELPRTIPPRVIVRNRRFSDFEAIDIFRSSRAVILPYQEASQSGVQVAAMQYGSPVIVTRVGALPEFQPAGQPSVEYGDESALREHIISFAAMADSVQESINSRAQYERRHSDAAVKKGLSELLGAL